MGPSRKSYAQFSIPSSTKIQKELFFPPVAHLFSGRLQNPNYSIEFFIVHFQIFVLHSMQSDPL